MNSSYERIRTKAFDVNDNKHPIREEIRKCLGVYDFTAEFEEDTATFRTFEHIPGLVAFICTLRKGDKIIGVGRGSSVINRLNRYVERAVHTAFNATLLNATFHAARVLNSFHPSANSQSKGLDVALPDVYLAKTSYCLEGITGKQKAFLLELIRVKITDRGELSRWELKIDNLTKEEASEAIQSFKK